MWKLHLKIAVRNLLKNKIYGLINVFGLAIGLAACLLLLLYAGYEWGYDRKFKNSPHLYQVMINLKDHNGQVARTIDLSQNVMLAALKEKFPEVLQGARVTDAYKRLVSYKTNSLKLNNRYVDASFLSLFDYQFISGNAAKALNDPNAIILTATAAKKIFGTIDVLNKEVLFENQVALKVTGVIKDIPANTSHEFEILTPWMLYENLNQWPKTPNWRSHDYHTLIQLREDVNVAAFNSKLKGLIKNQSKNTNEEAFLYPLTKLHLYGDFANGVPIGGKITQVRLFLGLAIGILLIACINFMNLATASTQTRAKEIGVKKTMGATRTQLMSQFMLEAFLLTALAILLSVILIEFSLPTFNQLLGIEITIDYLAPVNWLLILLVLVLTTFLAGSYPAFYLSGFNAIQSLKRNLNFQNGAVLTFRQVLVVVQFSFSILLIAATLTIYQQIQFIKNRPLGYDTAGLVEIPHEGLLYEKFELLKTRLLASGAVVAVTQSSGSISAKNSSISGLAWQGMAEKDKLIDFDQLYTTYDFIKTTQIKLLQGRDFNEKFATDQNAILLSKKAVALMQLKNPIEQRIHFQGRQCQVIGVFDDVIWGDPSKNINPMVIAFAPISDVITMRLNPQKNLGESVDVVAKLVKELNPNFPFQLHFLSTLNENKLSNERILGVLANLFGCLAIFVSCLGLFGLSLFTTAQRIKEVSIRKVLGASVTELIVLLSSGFIKLIVISIVLAMPIAYFMLNNWLQQFEVKTTLNWWIFIFTALLTLLISILAMGWQTYRTAKTNVVAALKYE